MCIPLAGEALFFLLDQKEPKNQVSREASLSHWPLPCKSGKTSGCKQLPYFVRSTPVLQQIFAMPFPTHKASMFCLISPEAVLLTGKRKIL
jgi:hypothetical protein